MDKLKKQKKKLTKKKTFEKIAWYDWYDSLIGYVLKPLKVFLKPRIIVNQNFAKLRLKVKRSLII